MSQVRKKSAARPSVYRRNTCRLCDSREIVSALKLAATPPGDIYLPEERKDEEQPVFPLELALCRACGFVQLFDVVDPDLLYGSYIYVTQSSPGLPEHFKKYAESALKRLSLPEGGFLVEFGSNDGTLLRCFRERGLEVLGVDPAAAVASAASEAGVETLNAYFDSGVARRIRENYGPADAVIANNVVANIDDLAEVGAAVRELLAPNGVFVLESGYLLDLVENNVFDNIYHEHLSYLSVKPMATFFLRCGLELIDVERVPTKGGSIRMTIQKRGGKRTVSPAVADLRVLEETRGLYGLETYRACAGRLARMKAELGAFLDEARTEGKRIAGYGASVSVTTLGYYFDVWDRLDFIVDDNPIKQHRYSPGAKIPVFPSEELYKRKPDYALILPWRFCGPIRKRHEAYTRAGGRFILPVPALEIFR